MVRRFLIGLITVLVGAVTLILNGCSKDEFTEPATVTVEFQSTAATAMNGELVIERLDLNLAEIDISGRRTSEGDMFFTRKFSSETGHFALMDSEIQSTVLQIPQGSYQSLVFYTTVREEEYEFEYGSSDGEDDETGDLQEYILKAKPGLLVAARYSNGGDEFPVIVSLNDDIRRFAVEAFQNGGTTVLLQKEIPAQATFTLDPEYLFGSITETMLQSAVTFPLNGEDAVVISEEYNVSMYNQLANRMQGSVALLFVE